MKHFILIILALASSIITSAQLEIPARLTDRSEQIIHHTGFTLSYNKDRGTPNWSAWVLTKSHLSGHEPRSPQFFADPLVPIAYRVQPTDYQGSGYDRGHMCPAADMQWNPVAMKESFYMSNMAPQTPTLNRVYWKQLEDKCRKWVISEDTLYIVSGPIYKPPYKRIGRTHYIDIPTGFYKVVLSLRKSHQKAIGFYYVNSSNRQSLQATATTVDAIEKITGINFFYTLEDNLEDKLESSFNLKDWK